VKGKIKMKKLILINCLLLVAGQIIHAQQSDFPKLTGPYLGQKPPGKTPELFAPEIFNPNFYSWYHSVIVFSPDGKEAFWQAGRKNSADNQFEERLFTTKQINEKWTEPMMLPFLEGNGDSPVISPDGKKLFFLSVQPIPGLNMQRPKENIWVSVRIGDRWSEPKPLSETINSLDLHWQISQDKNGNLYFGKWRVDPETRRTLEHDIYVARLQNDKYEVPEKLEFTINNPDTRQFSPHISPEGDYLLFSRTTKNAPFKTTLHLSYLDKAGRWMPPLNLSDMLHITGENAKITPDGKYMFFLKSGREVYWMDASFIKELRPKELQEN
jgi:Tol biopolymer transport system component